MATNQYRQRVVQQFKRYTSSRLALGIGYRCKQVELVNPPARP